MTLTALLEINLSLLDWDTQRGLEVAERLWRDAGRPTESRALAECLESAIAECGEDGVLYPAILLKRKKQLDRAEWRPTVRAQSTKQVVAMGDACPDCAGRGLTVNAGGASGSLCMKCLGTGRAKTPAHKEAKR